MKTSVSSSNTGGKARQPAQPPAHAHTPWSSTWRSWPCRGAEPQRAPLRPTPPAKGDTPAAPNPPRPLQRGDRPHAGQGQQAKPPLLCPRAAQPQQRGLRTDRGSGSAEPGGEPRHSLTVTGGASSSHLPACFLAF